MKQVYKEKTVKCIALSKNRRQNRLNSVAISLYQNKSNNVTLASSRDHQRFGTTVTCKVKVLN